MNPHAPALYRFFHRAAQRLGDDLMAEANSHQRNGAGRQVANESFQGWNPRFRIIGPKGAAGDQIAVVVGRLGQLLAVDKVNGFDVPIGDGRKKPHEHLRIAAVFFRKVVGRATGFQNCNFHKAAFGVKRFWAREKKGGAPPI